MKQQLIQKQKPKIKKEENIKYFWILIILFLVLWRVPLLFLRLEFPWGALFPVITFLISYFIVELIRKRKRK